MRVSHVMAPGPLGGAENVVLEGCAALVDRGHELTLWVIVEARCPQHGERFIAAAGSRGIRARGLPVRGRVDLGAVVALRSALKAQRHDVVHAHGYKGLMYAMLARPRGSRFVATHHGETGHDALTRFYERVARVLYQGVDRVFAVSHATSEALVDAGVPRCKVETVSNPVALGPSEPDTARSGIGLQLLFLGRLSDEKGLDVLLRALASPHVPSSLELDVAGDGPRSKDWRALAATLGLDGRVRWLGMRRDVPALLANADVLVLPSRREGLPLAVLEAMSCGVPVLASRVGGVPEAVWEGENGVLVEVGNIDAWSSALATLPERIETLRDGARRRAAEVRARHAPERWAAVTTAHYKQLAKPTARLNVSAECDAARRTNVPLREPRDNDCFKKAHHPAGR